MRAVSAATIQVGEQAGDHLLTYVGYVYRGWALTLLGRYTEAQGDWDVTTEANTRFGGRLIFSDVMAAGQAELLFRTGRLSEALALAETAVSQGNASSVTLWLPAVYRVWGQALATLIAAGQSPEQNDAADQQFEAGLHLSDFCQYRIESAARIWRGARSYRGVAR